MAQAFNKLIPMAVATALLSVAVSWAQEVTAPPAPGDAAKSVAAGEAVALPAARTSGDVSYVTGGIPYEQIPAFTKARGQYPLQVEIYQKSGAKNEFTADAGVKLIAAKSGDIVLDANTEGPYLWAKVPPGQYRLQVTLNGQMKESRVNVGNAQAARAVVVFPRNADE